MKAYIKIDATKELPQMPGYYIVGWTDGIETYEDSCSLSMSKKWVAHQGTAVRYWLKEIALSELMIEAIKSYNERCRVLAGISEQAPTVEDFISEFLLKKV